jgi:hypothetical protein
MYFLATGTITQPDQIGPHMQEETRELNELRELGLVREAFRKTAGPGVIGILQAASLDEARAQMGMLPFVALGLMTFEYTELTELQTHPAHDHRGVAPTRPVRREARVSAASPGERFRHGDHSSSLDESRKNGGVSDLDGARGAARFTVPVRRVSRRAGRSR